MPAFSILFSPVSKAVIGSITLDASLRETHSDNVEVTDNPIEDGSINSDHAFEQPFTLSIEGLVTDSPVRILSGIRSIAKEGQDSGGLIGQFIFPKGATRSASAHRALRKLKAEKEPIKVITGLESYKNMVITSYVVDRDKSRGKALWFTMSFKQIKIATAQTILIPANKVSKKNAANDKAASTQDTGKQDANVPTGKQNTALASISDFFFK